MPDPHGDRSTSPSAKIVTLRWWRRPSASVPETFVPDRAVAAAEPGVRRVIGRWVVVDRPLDRPPALHEVGEMFGRDRSRRAGRRRPRRRTHRRTTRRPRSRAARGSARRRRWPSRSSARSRIAPSRTRPSSTSASACSRPDGTSTQTSVTGSTAATRPVSIAHVTPAMVPCPHAVEKPSLWKNTMPNEPVPSRPSIGVGRGHEAAVHVGVTAGLVDEERSHVVEVRSLHSRRSSTVVPRGAGTPPVTIR